uniref:Uncharacterized protein n=1 Tax=Romanomermis culicivorax TaxID=13658 RepID=A0A915I0M1_ROMCU
MNLGAHKIASVNTDPPTRRNQQVVQGAAHDKQYENKAIIDNDTRINNWPTAFFSVDAQN